MRAGDCGVGSDQITLGNLVHDGQGRVGKSRPNGCEFGAERGGAGMLWGWFAGKQRL